MIIPLDVAPVSELQAFTCGIVAALFCAIAFIVTLAGLRHR